MTKISYFLSEGFQNILKSKIEALSSITTISMCIFIIGIMYMAFATISGTVDKIQNDMNIIAYLDSSTSRLNAEGLKNHILTFKNIESAVLHTKEEALAEFTEGMQNGENIYEQFKDDNPLRDSIRIKLKDINDRQEITSVLEGSAFVKRIVQPVEAAEFLNSLNKVIQLVSMVFIVILVAMSVALIVNTIKLTVYIRKNDISIMKYIGATDWFVRLPFIIEGILIGVIGTALPLIILYFLYILVINSLTGSSSFLYNFLVLRDARDLYAVLIPLCSFIGVGIGTIGSVISIKRYLEV